MTAPRPLITLRAREAIEGWLFVSPIVIGFAIFFAGPLVAVVGYSFTEWNLLSRRTAYVGLANYADAFLVNPQFWDVLGNSLVFAGGLVPLNMALALSLALSGASAAGMVAAPLLVLLSGAVGFGRATLLLALVTLAVLLPLVAVTLAPASDGEQAGSAPTAGAGDQGATSREDLLRSPRFWTMAAPFALGLIAQVGLLTHQLSYLTPVLGAGEAASMVSATALSALIGRLLTGLVVDRFDRRSAACGNFLIQATGMVLLLAASGSLAIGIPAGVHWPILLGCLLFGFGVGNMITFPSLIAQQEYPRGDFARVVSLTVAVNQFAFAFGPGLLGWLAGLGGSYDGALWACLGLQALGAAIVLLGRGRS